MQRLLLPLGSAEQPCVCRIFGKIDRKLIENNIDRCVLKDLGCAGCTHVNVGTQDTLVNLQLGDRPLRQI